MRYLKTGIISLMLLLTHSALAEMDKYKTIRDNTVKGTIVELDKEQGVGILKQSQTNKLVHFRFAEKMKEKNIESLKVGHVVEFTLGREKKAVAALN